MLNLEVPLWLESDVVVAGGGPAGVAAALAAARSGSSVVLLEKGGCCGGLGTQGLVPMFFVGGKEDLSFACGTTCEIVKEACEQAGLPRTWGWQTTDPEVLKRIYDAKLLEAGVTLRYEAKIATVLREGDRIDQLLVATAGGLKAVRGKVYIDATGDGAVSAFAGAPFELGDASGATMSPTLCAQYSNLDLARYEAWLKAGNNPRQIWMRLQEEGKAPLLEYHFVGIRTYGHGTSGGNLGHIYGVNGVDEESLTFGLTEGRKIAKLYFDFYRQNVPGFEHADLVHTAELLGVRETRRITGDYQLTYQDYCERASFPDEIGRYNYPVDIHASVTDAEAQKKVEEELRRTTYRPGESYGIPYRTLCPRGVRNLLVAGRCISTDRAAQSSVRVIPGCFTTGQAAGFAAALAVAGGNTREIPVAKLQSTIRAYDDARRG